MPQPDGETPQEARRRKRITRERFDLRRRLVDQFEDAEEADLELDEESGEEPGDGRARKGILRYIWPKRDLSREERREVLAQLFPERGENAIWLSRHFALMGFSVAIATFGLLNDSAAVVIGAMLVAPLMTPMMGYAAAMVMAWPRRQAWALTVVSISAAYGIALAILLSLFVPTGSALGGLPSEVLARTEPNFLDLFIALAAGAAGAYVTVHPRVGAALPGVAIAVALVPPLATIGITIRAGAWDDAAGASLLFATNWAAIALAAAAVFLASGVTPRRRAFRYSGRIKFGVGMAVIVVLAIMIPLGFYSQQEFVAARDRVEATDALDDWIGDRDLRVVDLIVDEGGGTVDVTAVVAGPTPPAATEQLATDLAAALDGPVDVEVRYTSEASSSANASP